MSVSLEYSCTQPHCSCSSLIEASSLLRRSVTVSLSFLWQQHSLFFSPPPRPATTVWQCGSPTWSSTCRSRSTPRAPRLSSRRKWNTSPLTSPWKTRSTARESTSTTSESAASTLSGSVCPMKANSFDDQAPFSSTIQQFSCFISSTLWMNLFIKCQLFMVNDNINDGNMNEASANVLFRGLLWLDESPAGLFMFYQPVFDFSSDLAFSTWTPPVVCVHKIQTVIW